MPYVVSKSILYSLPSIAFTDYDIILINSSLIINSATGCYTKTFISSEFGTNILHLSSNSLSAKLLGGNGFGSSPSSLYYLILF